MLVFVAICGIVAVRDVIIEVFCKSRGCNNYGFLHLDCHAFSLKKLSAKIISFRTGRFNLALFITALI